MVKNFAHSIILADQKLFMRLTSLKNKAFAENYFRLSTRSADGWLYGLYGMVLLLQNTTQSIDLFSAMAIAFAIQIPLYLAIKNAVKRKRPFDILAAITYKIKAPDRYSFPSGHTACAFLAARFLFVQIPELWPLIFFWALSVALSRVYLRVHFPGDVFAGAVLGLLSAEVAIWL